MTVRPEALETQEGNHLESGLPAVALGATDEETARAALRVARRGPRSERWLRQLIETLDTSRSRLVRWAVVHALGQLGPVARPAVPALRLATQDPSGDVRVEAEDALRRILGDPGTSSPP